MRKRRETKALFAFTIVTNAAYAILDYTLIIFKRKSLIRDVMNIISYLLLSAIMTKHINIYPRA